MSIPKTEEETEEFFMHCCEIMPEQRVRKEVSLLKKQGYELKLEDLRMIFRLSCILGVSVPMMFTRLLQVYPDLKKRLAI